MITEDQKKQEAEARYNARMEVLGAITRSASADNGPNICALAQTYVMLAQEPVS